MSNILLGLTGSVASILANELFASLEKLGNLKIICTEKALYFVPPRKHDLYQDSDEWHWKQKGDPILHIELRKWADVFVIAPLSANTLGKIANGLCDNLLTSVARAWDFNKPFVVAPSMNTVMWEHPITETQLETLQFWGVKVVQPQEKTLACGDTGIGAMADIFEITYVVQNRIAALGAEL